MSREITFRQLLIKFLFISQRGGWGGFKMNSYPTKTIVMWQTQPHISNAYTQIQTIHHWRTSHNGHLSNLLRRDHSYHKYQSELLKKHKQVNEASFIYIYIFPAWLQFGYIVEGL